MPPSVTEEKTTEIEELRAQVKNITKVIKQTSHEDKLRLAKQYSDLASVCEELSGALVDLGPARNSDQWKEITPKA